MIPFEAITLSYRLREVHAWLASLPPCPAWHYVLSITAELGSESPGLFLQFPVT